MNDKKDELKTIDSNVVAKKIRIGAGSDLHQRVAGKAAKTAEANINAATLPNRIGMMLDCSGSMGSGDKIEMCRIAGEAFLSNCDDSTTAVAVNTFEPSFRVNLTTIYQLPITEIQKMHVMGGTPMGQAMSDMLLNEPITRGIVVSDGEATDDPIPVAASFKDAGIPIDCVHIGDSSDGEETLKRIASMTGGMYIKFTNVQNFAQNFKYLTPRYRALLNAPGAAQLIGAKEVLHD